MLRILREKPYKVRKMARALLVTVKKEFLEWNGLSQDSKCTVWENNGNMVISFPGSAEYDPSRKTQKVRVVGSGLSIEIPAFFVSLKGVSAGDRYIEAMNEYGELVIVFESSKEFEELNKEG